MTRHIAIATCAELPDGDPDDRYLVAALTRIGFDVSIVPWDAPQTWATFDATVLRTTWDYTARRAEFLTWARTVPRLFNPVAVVEANSDKRYLAGLARAGLPVVPTTFLEPGEPVELPATGEFVLKPSVGAGSRGAGRFDAAQSGALHGARKHAEALHGAGRTVLVQPYQSGVDTAGESALVFIDGTFSHSIRKGPMLAPGTHHQLRDEKLFIPENITPRQADPAEIELAGRVLAELTKGLAAPLLYARIDLLPGTDGPVVVEAELTEPTLFFEHSAGAADRFAAALAGRLG